MTAYYINPTVLSLASDNLHKTSKVRINFPHKSFSAQIHEKTPLTYMTTANKEISLPAKTLLTEEWVAKPGCPRSWKIPA